MDLSPRISNSITVASVINTPRGFAHPLAFKCVIFPEWTSRFSLVERERRRILLFRKDLPRAVGKGRGDIEEPGSNPGFGGNPEGARGCVSLNESDTEEDVRRSLFMIPGRFRAGRERRPERHGRFRLLEPGTEGIGRSPAARMY